MLLLRDLLSLYHYIYFRTILLIRLYFFIIIIIIFICIFNIFSIIVKIPNGYFLKNDNNLYFKFFSLPSVLYISKIQILLVHHLLHILLFYLKNLLKLFFLNHSIPFISTIQRSNIANFIYIMY